MPKLTASLPDGVTLVSIAAEHAAAVVEWRTRPANLSKFVGQATFTLESRLDRIQRTRGSATDLNRIALRQGTPVGMVALYDLVVATDGAQATKVEPLIATGRDAYHPSPDERVAEPSPLPESPTAVAAMVYRLKTPDGQKLNALRKQVPEPVFGIIKSVLGFRQFLLRRLDRVRGKWSLVATAWNMKRIFALRLA